MFQPSSGFKEKDVVLSVAGEEEIVYGQEINYRVRYRNNQGASLSKVVLQVRYPEGFVFIDSSRAPSNEKKDEWDLRTINKQDSGYIDIRVKLYGTLGDKQSLRAFLNYKPANFSSEEKCDPAFESPRILVCGDIPVMCSLPAGRGAPVNGPVPKISTFSGDKAPVPAATSSYRILTLIPRPPM